MGSLRGSFEKGWGASVRIYSDPFFIFIIIIYFISIIIEKILISSIIKAIMYCKNCYVDIYDYEECCVCMKCESLFCMHCEQFNEDDLLFTDDDNNVYKKKCTNC